MSSPRNNQFATMIVGQSFQLFAKGIAAQAVQIELGFVDPVSTEAGQNTAAIAANTTLLDPALDVFAGASGANKLFIAKYKYEHQGGDIVINFDRVKGSAFISFARILDAHGKVIAQGNAEDWQKQVKKPLPSFDNRSYPYRRLAVGAEPFFNADHSPIGAWASFVYGMKQSGGVQGWGQGGENGVVPNHGVIMAVQRDQLTRIMPFAVGQTVSNSEWIHEVEVKRSLGASSDHWEIPMGVSWTHYTPVWPMSDWATASRDERRRFVLPVTYMEFVFDNQQSASELRFLFSLEQNAEGLGQCNIPGLVGYRVRNDTLMLASKSAVELISAETAKSQFGVDGASSAMLIRVPPHANRKVTVYVVHDETGSETEFQGQKIHLMGGKLFSGLQDIADTAVAEESSAIQQSEIMDKRLKSSGLNQQREFLAAQALHSYQFNTILYAKPDMSPLWAVIEGQYGYINTFDLTVDHLFYELSVHPWTVRNELDTFRDNYSYTDELSLEGVGKRYPGGIGFYHDMGIGTRFSSASEGANYERPMTQEELQNWILCAALYWKKTADTAWLTRNRDTLHEAFRSMQIRDDIDPQKRDGITTYISVVGQRGGEITTYDSMDRSLRQPQNNLYISVKSFAVYSLLQDVFRALGDEQEVNEARRATEYTARSIEAYWDPVRGMFPATFGTKNNAAIIPAIEGLVYPFAMGRREDVSDRGPYAKLIRELKQHAQSVLKPGICIDSQTGGWNLSSLSGTTWVSKVFLNQYVAEKILGIGSGSAQLDADEAHYAYEVLGSPVVGFADQIYTDQHTTYAGRHYPRGVTTALWWLWQEK